MKKFMSFLIALSAVIFTVSAASASDITVKVNGRTVNFREEPKPIILNDRTYVPIRRVLEQMGASVEWDDETRTVIVSSYDNIKMVYLTIDNPEITVYTFTSVTHADKETVISDVAPIILNDRTMLPIRVIAEALGDTVEYDELGIVDITTSLAKIMAKKNFGKDIVEEKISAADAFSETIPTLSLYSDAKDIKEGDTVCAYVKVSNFDKTEEGNSFTGLVTTVLYDTENFSFDGFKCITDEGETSPALSASNGTFYDNGAKVVYILSPDTEHAPAEDGTVLMLEFTALNDNGGSFSISDGISELGYDNEIILTKDGVSSSLSKYDELFVDTTELVVK